MKKTKESRVSDLFEIAQAASYEGNPYINILEWLYTHERACSSVKEWRKGLLKVIRENL